MNYDKIVIMMGEVIDWTWFSLGNIYIEIIMDIFTD